MTATATPPAGPPPAASPDARAQPPLRPPRPGRGAAPLLRAPLARVLALTAFGTFAALRWGTLVDPSGGGRMLLLLAFALAAGLAVAQLARLPAAAQAPGAIAVVVGWAALSAIGAGVRASLVLNPDHWDDLLLGLQQGIEQLPSVLVPYGQPDVWPRIAILLGGALLLALGCVIALTPGRQGVPFRDGAPFGGGIELRLTAAVPLLAAAVVPSAIMEPDHPVLLGAALFALLAAFLWLERLPRAHAPAALALAVLAAAGALVVAPRLDSEEPWVDVQALVEDLDTPAPARFDWSQSYGPLDWPRDGREVLRVESDVRAYWKAANLDGFDGVRWVRAQTPGPTAPDDEVPQEALARGEWRTDVRVTLRSFSTNEVVAAGTTLRLDQASTSFQPGVSPGTWVSDEPLEPGDGYVAETVVPRPTTRELRTAGTAYPDWAIRYLLVGLPQRHTVRTRRWIGGGGVVLPAPFGAGDGLLGGDAATLAASPYARADALAKELRADAPTPYAYVRRVLAHLRDGFTYDERPPRRQLPLDAFLFGDRAGYCQQFAGAAALLLRLGGVPTRVVAGFTSGSRDGARGEWIVRDYDAHAWVEVWFPRIGWVRFDPTPSSAPARSGRPPEPSDAPAVTAPSIPRLPDAAASDAARPPPVAGGGEDGDGGGTGVWPIAGGIAALALLGGAAAFVRGARRAPRDAEALLAELERALRRTGRPPQAPTTLAQLEHRFHDAPEAAAYVRAIRLARYGDGEAAVTPRQRRALRGELARDLGLGGRLRAWLALPPRFGA